jgi:hypothetical protein
MRVTFVTAGGSGRDVQPRLFETAVYITSNPKSRCYAQQSKIILSLLRVHGQLRELSFRIACNPMAADASESEHDRMRRVTPSALRPRQA